MYCLNCGTHLESEPDFCPGCNIKVELHGTMRESFLSTGKTIKGQNSVKSENQCPNCMEPLESESSEKCNVCNYRISLGKKKIYSRSKSENGFLKFSEGEIPFHKKFGFN